MADLWRFVILVVILTACIADASAGSECSHINPCLHRGVCIQLQEGFSCLCLEPYTGNLCDTKIPGVCLQPVFDGYLNPEKLSYELGETVVFICPVEFYLKGLNEATCGIKGWSSQAPPECVLKEEGSQYPTEIIVGLSTGAILVLAFFIFAVLYLCKNIYTRSSETDNRYWLQLLIGGRRNGVQLLSDIDEEDGPVMT